MLAELEWDMMYKSMMKVDCSLRKTLSAQWKYSYLPSNTLPMVTAIFAQMNIEDKVFKNGVMSSLPRLTCEKCCFCESFLVK